MAPCTLTRAVTPCTLSRTVALCTALWLETICLEQEEKLHLLNLERLRTLHEKSTRKHISLLLQLCSTFVYTKIEQQERLLRVNYYQPTHADFKWIQLTQIIDNSVRHFPYFVPSQNCKIIYNKVSICLILFTMYIHK